MFDKKDIDTLRDKLKKIVSDKDKLVENFLVKCLQVFDL